MNFDKRSNEIQNHMYTLDIFQSEHRRFCPLCKNSTPGQLASELRRGVGKVYWCPECCHGFLTDQISVDSKLYYDGEYRKEFSHRAEATNTDPREIFEIYKLFQQGRLDIIEPKLTGDSRLLEVGASSGQFLVHLINKVSLVNAIELDSACCRFLGETLGVDADSTYLSESRFSGNQYDVVCAFQVMEHVDDSVAFLESLRRVTAPGGWIFIEVPNLQDPLLSVWSPHAYSRFFYHSAHVHYFTEHSLTKVANSAGFSAENIEIVFTQDYNLLNHLHWVMNNGPQADCLIGLNEVALSGKDPEITAWLNQELKILNRKYVDRLVKSRKTSNLMMILRNEF